MATQTVAAPAAEHYLTINNIEVIYDHVILVLKGCPSTSPKAKSLPAGANGREKRRP